MYEVEVLMRKLNAHTVEEAAWEQGTSVEELPLDDMESAWQRAKLCERER